MLEKYTPQIVETTLGENEEKMPETIYAIGANGVLFVDGFGDLNEPYNADALDPDPATGKSKVETWLETEKDEKGRYVKAWFKDKAAYNRHWKEINERGRRMREKGGEKIKGIIPRIGRGTEIPATLDNFNRSITTFIGSGEYKDMIDKCEVTQLNSKAGEPLQFRMRVTFIDEWRERGRQRINLKGTYEEIVGALEKKLHKLSGPVHAVDSRQ
ncbi:MAG: hypothetical protein NTW66_04180 [Candidatus Magasanikbacteria bacterium]|nr:hypothetical protein [Candidatus Magasanikbacteria bacterium]